MANLVTTAFCVLMCLKIVVSQFGFFPAQQQNNGNYEAIRNIPRRITNSLTGMFQVQQENRHTNQRYIYPFEDKNRQDYNQYHRPQNQHNRPFQRPSNQNGNIFNNQQFGQYNPEVYTPNPIQANTDATIIVIEEIPDNDKKNENQGVNFEPVATETPKIVEPSQPPVNNEDKTNEEKQVNNNGYNNNQPNTEGLIKVPAPVNFENKYSNEDTKPVVPTFDETNNNGFGNGFGQNPGANGGLIKVPASVNDDPNLDSAAIGQVFGGQVFPNPERFDESKRGPSGGLIKVSAASISNAGVNFGSENIFSEDCHTIDGKLGGCKSIYFCPEYLQLLKDARTNPQAVQQLRKVHCGFEGDVPKVCCPRPGFPQPPFDPNPDTTTTTTPASVITEPARPKTADSEDYVAALPDAPVCGSTNASFSRVVGGIPAKLGDFPWMALLGYRTKRSPIEWLCGGSLVTSRHILTATHCIHKHENQLYVVRLGELDLAREDDGASPVDYLIMKQIVHEQYSPTAYTNDIALLLLEKEVIFTDLIRPICLPRASELRSRSFENYTPLIAGWGNVEFRGASATHLQVLQLPVLATDYCVKAYAKYKNQVIDGRNICAGFKSGGKDACQGDSGGPLMQPIWNSELVTTFFYQIGVISYGKGCAEAGFPGIYTRVTEFIPWIEEKVLGTI